MNILFMMDKRANAGSIQAVACYVRAGDGLGHTIALYGRPDPKYPGIRWSTELDAFDRVVLIVEDRISWLSGLPLIRLLSQVPRERRAILDADACTIQSSPWTCTTATTQMRTGVPAGARAAPPWRTRSFSPRSS